MRYLPGAFGGLTPKAKQFCLVGALAALVASPAVAFDGFSVNSSTFANKYDGNQIWDGSIFQNGWTAGDGLTNAALTLNGSALVVNNAADGLPLGNNGWVQQDSGTSPWEVGTGNWTIELSAKVNEATAAADNFVLWGTVGGSRMSITVEQNSVRYGEGGADLINGITNDDAYHTFRIAYDSTDLTASTLGTYHVWRDNVPISGTGLARVAADGTARLIVGDCCTGIGNPVDPFEIQYVRYDMTGAYSPIGPQGTMSLEINRDTRSITFKNTTGAPLANIIGYAITSSAGTLNQTGGNWDKQSTGTNLANDNDQWTQLTGTVNELAEGVFVSTGDDNGGDVLATTGQWSFGTAWRKSPFEDVNLELLIDDGSEDGLILTNGGGDFLISYIGNGGNAFATGDLNYDGDVTPADWVLFKSKYQGSNLASFGTPVASHKAELYNAGDLNVDGAYTLADFGAFEAAYDAANGVGAFAAIPEPATSTLLVICGTTFMMYRRRTLGFAKGRRIALLLAAAAAAMFAMPTAQAQNTITNLGSVAPGDKSNDAAFAFRANGGTFPSSVSPANSLTDLFVLSKMTLKRPDDATTPTIGTGTRQLTSTATPVFLDVYTGLNGGTDTFSGYVGSSSTSVAWTGTVQNTTYSFDFSNLLLSKTAKYWFVFSEDNADGEVSNFRHRVVTGGNNTGAGDNAAGYLLNDTAQVHTQGGGETDWGTEYVAEFSPVSPLTLRVNRTTGNVSILDDGSAIDFSINSYSITSTNSLVTANWSSLQDQVIGGDPTPGNKDDGNSWEEFDNVSSAFVGEGFLTSSTTIVDNDPLDLGDIFLVGGDENLAFTYTATNGGLPAGGLVTGVVEYFDGLEGDFDGDADVDGNDFLKWQRGESTNGLTLGDLNDWKANFGAGATVAVGAVPEPSSALLVMGAAVLLASRRLRRLGVVAAAAGAICSVVAGANRAAADVYNDRHYSLGDLSNVGYDTEGVNLTAFPGAVDSGAYQDLVNNGGVTTTNVGAGGLNRPGLVGAANGALFDGVDDSLTTAVSLNSPNHTWNTAAFFPTALIPPDAVDDGLYDAPSAGGVSSDGDLSYTPAFPHNYTGIFGRGIQAWARPTNLAGALRQDIVMDSTMHGIFISATNTWGLQFDSGAIDSGVSVASTLDGNGWAHVMEISGQSAPKTGNSAFGGALLVNGVAVAGGNTFYDPNTSGFSIGSNQAHDNNFYTGALDELRVFLWGDNSSRDPNTNTLRGYLGGANWGSLDLAEDNDWIKQKLASLGVTNPADVNLSGGAVNAADATAFIGHWRKTFTVGGLQVGDWNSRQQGDLNYDGVVNMSDAYILHTELDAVGLSLNFEMLSQPVPEPSTWAMLVSAGAAIGALGRRRGRCAC